MTDEAPAIVLEFVPQGEDLLIAVVQWASLN
ncbi:hypothetical protein ACOI9X_04130 [Pseudomonas sp. P2757]